MEVKSNEDDLLNPAIRGTTEVLKSVKKNNPNAKRVVITSSFSSIVDIDQGHRPGYTYSEKDWNPVTYNVARSTDEGAVSYSASKVFAEKAAWEFVKKEKPNFAVTAICPPMVYGPAAHTVSSLDHLNTSSADIYRLMNGSEKSVPETQFFAFVDARDIGEAHAKAYEAPKAAGQRYFITAGSYTYQQVCDIIRKDFPEKRALVPEGTPGAPIPDVYHVDNSKAKKELGMTFRNLETCIHDQVAEFIAIEKKTGKA